jgi:uncharacterized membrane protein
MVEVLLGALQVLFIHHHDHLRIRKLGNLTASIIVLAFYFGTRFENSKNSTPLPFVLIPYLYLK